MATASQASTGGLLVTTGAACGTGGGSGPTVQTGSVNNISQVLLNFTNYWDLSLGATRREGVEEAALVSSREQYSRRIQWQWGLHRIHPQEQTCRSPEACSTQPAALSGSEYSSTIFPAVDLGDRSLGNSHMLDNGSQISKHRANRGNE